MSSENYFSLCNILNVKYKGLWNEWVSMCQCGEVNLVDVLYHVGKGNKLIGYHKNCGDDLSEAQHKQIQLLKIEKWNKPYE